MCAKDSVKPDRQCPDFLKCGPERELIDNLKEELSSWARRKIVSTLVVLIIIFPIIVFLGGWDLVKSAVVDAVDSKIDNRLEAKLKPTNVNIDEALQKAIGAQIQAEEAQVKAKEAQAKAEGALKDVNISREVAANATAIANKAVQDCDRINASITDANGQIEKISTYSTKIIYYVEKRAKEALDDAKKAQEQVNVIKSDLETYISITLKPYREKLDRLPEADKPFIKSGVIQVNGEHRLRPPWGNADDWEVIVIPIAPGTTIETYSKELRSPLLRNPVLKSHAGDINLYYCYVVREADNGWKIIARQRVDQTDHNLDVHYLMVSKLRPQ